MEKWEELEFEYAKRLRESAPHERRQLYAEAYTRATQYFVESVESNDPQDRTAGTSKRLVVCLRDIFSADDTVLEIGCGRGYTCLKLAPFVHRLVGTDVSEGSLEETKRTLSENGIENVEVKAVSAFSIRDELEAGQFTGALSIDVVEHLHPDDVLEHLAQVHDVLCEGGKYVIVTPNRLTGPHDSTREHFPDAKEPLGFHLNEMAYWDLVKMLKSVGFKRFSLFVPWGAIDSTGRHVFLLPWVFSTVWEILVKLIPRPLVPRVLKSLLHIRLVAYKG